MLTVYSDDHRLHDAKAEFVHGEMVPSFEMPKRADYILGRLREAKLGEIIAPERQPRRALEQIHSAGFPDLPRRRPWRLGGDQCRAMPCPTPGRAAACAR